MLLLSRSPDTGGQPCANSFRLWQQCPGWPSGLLGPMTPVSAERGYAVDLSPAAIRPCTSPTRWPASVGCASLRESNSRSPSWHYKVVHGLAPGVPRPFLTCRRPTQSTIAA